MTEHLPAPVPPQAPPVPVALTLSPRARELHSDRFADATQAAYGSDLAAWESVGVTIPADPISIVEALTTWHDDGLSPATLTRRAASLSTLHRISGYATPMEVEAVRSHLIAIRKAAAKESGPKRGRGAARAITPAELRLIVGEGGGEPQAAPVTVITRRQRVPGDPRQDWPVISECKRDGAAWASALSIARDRALILLGFCAALRRSEIVALDTGDITQNGHAGLMIHIRRSKTDQTGEGADVAVPYGGLGTETAEALQAWRDISGITEGPLFRSIDRHGNISKAAITPEAFNRIVRGRAAAAGINTEGVSAHSLRAGYVTAQAKKNTPEYRIQTVTRHKSAEVLRAYIRAATVMERTPDLVLD